MSTCSWNTRPKAHAQRKFVELIYNRTGKYANWDPSSEIRVGSYGRIERETGSLIIDGSIYDDAFKQTLIDACIDVESGEHLPEDCPDETNFATCSANVEELEVNPESTAEVPGIDSAYIKGTWEFMRGTTGAVLLMHNPRMKCISSDVLGKLARIRLLQHTHLVTKVFHCPGYFFYLSDPPPTLSCRWLRGDNVTCGFEGSADEIRAHFISHLLHGSASAIIECLWEGCGHSMRRDTILRHVRGIHLGMKRGSSTGRDEISIALLGSAPTAAGVGATGSGESAITWWSDTKSGLSCHGYKAEHYFTPLYDLKHVRPEYYRRSSSLPQRIPGEDLWYSPPVEASPEDLTRHITRVANHPHARGGFAEVFQCTYHVDQPPIKVAVKSLLAYTSDTPDKTSKKNKRIQHELGICLRLDHPNILPIYGYAYGFGLFMAIVTPWAENGNLTTYLEHNDADLTLVMRFQILKNVASGLQYMHANDVIHGDLTGPNVLIDADGTACLSDFGLSLVYSEVVGVNQPSWTSSFHGNFRWLAPELLEESETGPVRPNKHSDTYSFGGIMLQVITSRIPYYYLREVAVMRCVYERAQPDRSRYPEFSGEYWLFMEECWSAVAKDRPSSERILEVIGNNLVSLSVSNAES